MDATAGFPTFLSPSERQALAANRLRASGSPNSAKELSVTPPLPKQGLPKQGLSPRGPATLGSTPSSPTMPGQTLPTAGPPTAARPGQTLTGRTSPTAARPGQTLPTAARPGQTLPTAARPGQTRPTAARPGQTLPNAARPGPTFPAAHYPATDSPAPNYPGTNHPASNYPDPNAPAQSTPAPPLPGTNGPIATDAAVVIHDGAARAEAGFGFDTRSVDRFGQDEFDSASSQPVVAWRNPWLIALAVIGVGFLASGVWLFDSAYAAFNEGVAIQTQGDFAAAQVAMYSGPLLMLFGAGTLVGVLFMVAARWRPQR